VPRLHLLTPEQREVKNDPARRAKHRQDSVPDNIREICAEYFNWKLEEFQLEGLQAMFAGGYLVINWPTDHSKSTMGCFLFPLLSLMNNPDETHIICGANANDSRRRVQALTREIETNEALVRDFPWLSKPGKDAPGTRIWTSSQFNVSGRTINKPNPSVLAAGVGSNDIKGRRGKLIMDDIEGEDARWSPTKREQLYSWLKLEAWRCYEDKHESKRPLLCLMGTPFDIDSIYFRAESQEWRVLRRGCYLDGGLMPDEPKLDAAGKPWAGAPRKYLWPAKREKVEHARHHLRKLEFSVAYLMDPTGGDPSRISSAELMKATQEAKAVEEMNVALVALDPAAGGQGPKQDYAGVAVVRIHWPIQEELPNVEIQECHSFTQGLFEQVHMCAALSARYGYPVIYEINSQQGGTYQNAFAHLHPETQLLRHHTDHKTKFDTSMGLTVVKRLAVERKLRIPPEHMDEEGTVQLIQELRDLQPPFRTHNHIAAAIWFAVRYAYEQVRYHAVMPIRTTYGERIQRQTQSGPYFGGRPAAVAQYQNFGFRSYNYREDLLRREMEKEQQRFARQLQGGH
jgi:hypothetical protein